MGEKDAVARYAVATRIYAGLLLFFPKSFRRKYAKEMVSGFRQSSLKVRERDGRVALLAYWLGAVLDLPGAVFRVRREGGSPALPRSEAGPRVIIVDDMRQAVRFLRKSPGATGAALLILILAIGGTTAVFSVLNAVLLRPLPYADPHELAVLWTVNTRQNLPDGTSYLNFKDWQERTETFADMAMYRRPEFTTSTITSFGEPERVHVGSVTENFFELLGVTAIAGRTFSEGDIDVDSRVVVISEAFWRQRYGASLDVLGTTIQINGEDELIIGVVPSSVQIPRATTQIWQLEDPSAPMMAQYRGNDSYVVIARLRGDATIESARSDFIRIAAQLAEEYPETNAYFGASVRPLLAEITGERLPLLLWMLFGAVVLVLLVACTNVAHLMLARGMQRRRELALRAALGATRGRLMGQLLSESLLLGGLAGLGGVLLGAIALRTLITFIPGDVPRLEGVGLDPTVLLVAIVASMVAGPVFGLLPAVRSSRHHPAEALAQVSRGASNADRKVWSGMVVLEVAMAVVLLAEAGLLVRSVQAVYAVDPGFNPQSVLIAQVDLGDNYEHDEQIAAFYGQTLSRLRALPGVEGASAITDFFIERFPDASVTPSDREPADPSAPRPRLTSDQVYPGFFSAIGVPLLRGRGFTDSDLIADAEQVVIINQMLAQTFWPGEDPVGRAFRWGSRTEGPVLTVVGVVGDMRRSNLEEIPFPHIFVPSVAHNMDIAVRTVGDPLQAAATLRAVVKEIDGTVPVSRVSTAWGRFGDSMEQRRFQTMMFSAFAGLAVLLATIGLFALLNDAVSSRRREIGIRLALGAAPSAVRGMVVKQGVVLAFIGLAVGLVVAVSLSSVTASMVYGVSASDPTTLGLVSLILLAVAAAASLVPARRATRVHPVETLVSE